MAVTGTEATVDGWCALAESDRMALRSITMRSSGAPSLGEPRGGLLGVLNCRRPCFLINRYMGRPTSRRSQPGELRTGGLRGTRGATLARSPFLDCGEDCVARGSVTAELALPGLEGHRMNAVHGGCPFES